MIQVLIHRMVHIRFNSLNNELKVPFSMFLSGYKYNEIADKLGVPLGTVKSRIFFARQELQKELKDFRQG